MASGPAGKPLKVAIVHDWLIGGGAERVVQELHNMFPDAPIYTSYATKEWQQRLDGKVVTGWLQHFGALRKFLAVFRVWWFSHLDFTGYDLVISSTGNGEAKDIRVPKGTTHICYCHTPTHYYWRQYNQYLQRPGFGGFDPLARIGLRLLVGPLRRRDYRAAQKPDYFIANSTHIQNDIKQYYGRDSVVIHPPIDISRFTVMSNDRRSGFVTVGRQAPAKRTDVIVEACSRLGVPLTVVGGGPEHSRLQKLAGESVIFAPPASDADVADYMGLANAFLFASMDDFGITPVEALACGTPVIAYKAGGALDYVIPGKTGEFFTEQTAQSLAKALKAFNLDAYDPAAIRDHAEKFAPEVFRRKLTQLINEALKR
ncbi:MAG TPA: glycosyltransferase [Candidatus Saccharimonadales bacterium]|nr:glycosyltransferase [Candidatus Saccharimonadales bacterium]